MGKNKKWSWSSALIGVASTVAATTLISARPKDPTFQLVSVNLTSFKLNLPVFDIELSLPIHVTNPNIVPARYSSTTLSIYYDGSLLGSAQLEAGSQPARSCQLLRLPVRLNGFELAHHGSRVVTDFAKREMVLNAAGVVSGSARVLWWDHKFQVRVHSQVTVNPVLLELIDQVNRSEMQVLII